MSRLIIIRGNSGSGKSTIARLVQKKLGEGTMLISQDEVRIRMLNVEDKAGNPAIDLIHDLAMYGDSLDTIVILEGILSNKKYSIMLKKLAEDFSGKVDCYYIDVSFEETLKRHLTKTEHNEFGEEEMKAWWKHQDLLGFKGERLITKDMSAEEATQYIIGNIK